MLRITSLLGCLLLTISFIVPSAWASLTDGLVAYYPFNGNANDESGNGNHGTVYGATLTEDRFGNPDSAYNFDGVDDYIDIPYSDTMEPSIFTISLWFKMTTTKSKLALINESDGVCHHGYGLYVTNNKIHFETDPSSGCGDGTIIYSNDSVNDGIWHHIVAIYDADSYLKLYIDNVLQDDIKKGFAYSKTHVSIRVGMYRGDGRFFPGPIDDIRIYNRVLSESEIQQLANHTTITSIVPNFGSVSGGTQVVVKGDDFQEGAKVSIGGSELVDVKVLTEVAVSTTSQSIDITDVTTSDVTLRITLKEKSNPEVTGTIRFPTDSKVVANALVLKTFIETSIANIPELAGKIIVDVKGTGSAVTVTFTTVDKGTGVQLSVEQTSGSDVLFKTAVGDKGYSEIIGTTSPGTVGLHDVVVTNPDGGSDTLVRGFAYMPDCELPPDVTTNTLVVTGTVYSQTGDVAENGLPVEVSITTQRFTENDDTGKTAGKGQYSVTFFDVQKPVAKTGDEILVTVKDTQGKLVAQNRHTLTAAEVEAKETRIDVTPFKTYDVKPVTVTLRKGINVIAAPVKEGLRMSDLAAQIGKDNLSMIIRYDYTQDKFVSYLPTFPDDSPANAVVQQGEGYIVVMKVEKKVEFDGNLSNDETAAPLLMPLVLSSYGSSTSIFVVTGNVRRENTGEALNEVAVRIRNLRTGQTVEDVTGALAGYGNYVATFVASSEDFITRAGDEIEITAMDKEQRFVITPVNYTLTARDISDYVLFKSLHLSLPKTSALLPNYPNPFNPETWLPYQLAQDANVTISIYNIQGHLIRTLHLGNQSAGVYVIKDRAAYWDGRDSLGQSVSSGAYFYTLQAGKFRNTRKMVILK